MTPDLLPTLERVIRPFTKRDSLDFRDLIYRPALVNLEDELLPDRDYMLVSDQGNQGACTGFGLAAVINYLLRVRGIPTDDRVSPRMLYEMARHHDQWPGEDYVGSSARGAMKGWYKNGVCSESAWPYDPLDPGFMTRERQQSALKYPLGAYYRIMRRRSDLHAALHETQVVFATAQTHTGWQNLQDGKVRFGPDETATGGHAFAIVGYTREGFIIQNSWGEGWGGVTIKGITYPGCAIWQYADFDENLWDAWVARLALPLESMEALAATTTRYTERPGGGTEAAPDLKPPRPTIREHYVHIDDGHFLDAGDYYSNPGEVRQIITEILSDRPEHILLFAHGGLNNSGSAAARVGRWRPVFQANRIHEIHFIWETGFTEELFDILRAKLGLAERRASGFSGWWDNVLERFTQPVGTALWEEMKLDAARAFQPGSAGDQFVAWLIEGMNQLPAGERPRINLAGHSAGSIWQGHLLRSWQDHGGAPISNLILLAPACTIQFFGTHIKPALLNSTLGHVHHFLLDDQAEQTDTVVGIYRKSLLYLVSRSFESREGEVPLLGLEKYLDYLDYSDIPGRVETYVAAKRPDFTASKTHGGFDSDETTMNSMLKLVLGRDPEHRFGSDGLTGYR